MTAVKPEQSSLIEILRTSNGAFIEHFHRPHLQPEDEIPDLHLVVADRMIDERNPQFACAIPRDHAKTTLVKIMIVKILLYQDYNFPMYVSDTHDVATSACQDIWNYLASPEFIELAGEHPEAIIKQESRGVYKFRMRWFPEGSSPKERHYKIVNMISRGAKQQVRGTNKNHMRPDILVMDDVETEEVMGSEDQFKSFSKWCYGTLFKAMRTGRNRKIQIGNLISARSLLMRHLESDNWSSMRYGALKSDMQPLWPQRWSVEALKLDYKNYADVGELATWYAEMMNLPFNPDSSLVDLEKVHYSRAPHPDDPRIVAAFINIDPAISDKATADNCALVVTVLTDEGRYQHVEVNKGRGLDYMEIYRRALALAEKWRSNLVFIEDVAFQKVLLQVFETQAAMDGVDLKFHPCPTGNAAKITRLLVWAGMLHSGQIHLSNGDTDISGELARFDRTKRDNRDDVIDACAQVPIVMGRHSHLILNSRVVSTRKSITVPVMDQGVST